jgi:hypothetical protein
MSTSARRAEVAATLALAALLLAACAQMAIDEHEAREAAVAFVEAQDPPGTTMRGVRVTSVREEPLGAAAGWVVEVEGTPARAGEAEGIAHYHILFIDGTNGEVTIEGQG